MCFVRCPGCHWFLSLPVCPLPDGLPLARKNAQRCWLLRASFLRVFMVFFPCERKPPDRGQITPPSHPRRVTPGSDTSGACCVFALKTSLMPCFFRFASSSSHVSYYVSSALADRVIKSYAWGDWDQIPKPQRTLLSPHLPLYSIVPLCRAFRFLSAS